MADTEALDWVRLDTNMPMNPKILRLISQPNGAAAAFAWVCSLTHSGLTTSSGFIPDEALPFIHCKKSLATLLVKNGLWTRHPEENGYIVHDYAKYNQTRETTTLIRKNKAIGGIRGNHVKAEHAPGTCNCEERIAAIERDEMPEKFTRT
jgi:hypothetical protein